MLVRTIRVSLKNGVIKLVFKHRLYYLMPNYNTGKRLHIVECRYCLLHTADHRRLGRERHTIVSGSASPPHSLGCSFPTHPSQTRNRQLCGSKDRLSNPLGPWKESMHHSFKTTARKREPCVTARKSNLTLMENIRRLK